MQAARQDYEPLDETVQVIVLFGSYALIGMVNVRVTTLGCCHDISVPSGWLLFDDGE